MVSDLATWHIVRHTVANVLAPIDATRWRISFWDAMILTAAHVGGAT